MRFIESILFKNGEYHNLQLHQFRMDGTFSHYGLADHSHDLNDILPDLKMNGTFKVRVVYDMDSEDAEYDIEFSEYHVRKIQALEIVRAEPFDYSMKFEDRTEINNLVKSSMADDIIIAIDNHLTDGSYFNLAFWNGHEWLTPDSYLLNGVRRQQLLNELKMKETTIQIHDLKNFEKISLINAMIDLGELELPISAIGIPKNDD